jgi:hypothetical protein
MIFGESLPFGKTFFAAAKLPATTVGMLTRLVVACFSGMDSASAAAEAIRTQAVHRAQIVRFLARCRWSNNWETLGLVADLLLQRIMAEKGTWVYITDQTYHSASGSHAQNTIKPHYRKNRSKKKVAKKKKSAQYKKSHCFIYGLLITPETGTRIPSVRSYYTEEYCKEQAATATKGKVIPTYKTQPEIAAEMIKNVAVPTGAKVLVLGDTAFDAHPVYKACRQRDFDWIFPANSNRVLAGKEKKDRPSLRSESKNLSSETMTRIELCPGQTPWRPHQRGCKPKAQKQKYSRLYWACSKTLDIHNVGQVGVVFSTTQEPKSGQSVNVQKVLLTNRTDWDASQIVAAYTVRWQIELFFKEMKSFLGMSSYRMRNFKEVEGWVQACTIAFVYLEYYRLEVGNRKDVKDWMHLRTSGLIRLVLQEIETADLLCIFDKMQTKVGRAWLLSRLENAIPWEYRKGKNAA